MDHATGNALAVMINEDCANLFIDQVYTYTGRVFEDGLGERYYEMRVVSRGRQLLKPTYLYERDGSYAEADGLRRLTLVEA